MANLEDMSHEARELTLYALNTREPYDRYIVPTAVALAKKAKKGTYSRDLALRAWKRIADAVAKSYAKDYDDERRWNSIFSVQDRKDAAEFFECRYDRDELIRNF